MSTRVIQHLLGATVVAMFASVGCAKPKPPPPCLGDSCRTWPHIDLRFSKNQSGRAYTGALCVQVSFDCPEEGRHQVWMEPEAPRCNTYLNDDDSPEWLKVERGRLSIPWPGRCQGDMVEAFVTAQPNFATCNAVNEQLINVGKQTLTGEIVFECR